MMNVKIYAAGPFFSKEQLATMETVEAVLEQFDDVEIFKPRDGAAAAKKLNKDIGAGKDPSAQTRHDVFRDNVDNIVDADLIVCVTDGRDTGTTFEMGAAYAWGVPIITFTNEGFGLNLMLAEAVLAHCQGSDQLRDAVDMFLARYRAESGRIFNEVEEEFEVKFKRANLLETKQADRESKLYKEDEE